MTLRESLSWLRKSEPRDVAIVQCLGSVEWAGIPGDVFPEKHNESLVTEFYINLTVEINDPNSPTVGQVYMKGLVIAFSPANITDFLSCPHYANIEGTGLEVNFDLDVVAKVLTGDDESQWLDNN